MPPKTILKDIDMKLPLVGRKLYGKCKICFKVFEFDVTFALWYIWRELMQMSFDVSEMV